MATDVLKAQAAAAAPGLLSDISNALLLSEIRDRYNAGAMADEHFQFLDFYDDDGIEDSEALVEAVHRWQRRDRREALYHLERALGRDFIGLGELKPEDLQ